MTDAQLLLMLERARTEYDFKYTAGGPVPANDTAFFEMAISADAHFDCKQMTGAFTTLTGAAVDGGASGMSFQIFDDGRDLRLFNDVIPAELVFSPGRQRSSGVAGDPSLQLFYPIEFDYLFKATSTVRFEVRNSLAFANDFFVCFHGTKYLVTPGE